MLSCLWKRIQLQKQRKKERKESLFFFFFFFSEKGRHTNFILIVDSSNSNHIHLICRVVQSSVKGAIISWLLKHLKEGSKIRDEHEILPMAETIIILFALSSQTFSTKGRSKKSGPPILRLMILILQKGSKKQRDQ